MEAIQTNGLTKAYKDIVAVKELNLSVRKGELFSLLGVNGAGKTTAIKMLCCLTQPTAGDAFLNGKSILHDTVEVKKAIALSPQETAVAPGLTVRENLMLMGGVSGFSKAEQKEKADAIVKQLGFDAVIGKKAGKLSGGWQRRLSIAMALICEPEILFLDEPTLGLDVIARSELWDLIRSLKGKMTIVLTTHYMEEAEALSDRVGIMKSGNLLACDTVEGIKAAAGADDLEAAFIHLVKGGTE